MKSIEINTTQNVVIEYELAATRDRIIAFIIDFIALMTGYGLLFSLLSWIFISDPFGRNYTYVIYLIIFPFIFFYSFLQELIFDGRSLGKLALGIKIVKTNGKQTTIGDYFSRWMFRVIDIYLSFGSIATILISSSEKSQRIGDIVANTTVIRIRSKQKLVLKDLLSIHSISTYTPRYIEAKKLTEPDMLLVKTVIDRYKKYKNSSHEDALNLTIKKLMDIMNITKLEQPKLDFLHTVLKDYIVLSR